MQTNWQRYAYGPVLVSVLACSEQGGGVPAGSAGGPADPPHAGESITVASPALDTVAADGVSGALMPGGFLADAGDGHRNLILLNWQIPPGREQYLCGRVTVPEDTYIHGFFPLSPRGTHHIALTVVSKPNGPDGVVECDISEVGPRNVFGGAVGTGGGILPDGLAMKLDRGSQIIFNLHLFNVSDAPLSGLSGTRVELTTPDKVKVLADGVAAGPLKLTVPPGRSVQTGVCTVDHDYTVFSVMPHMHQMGAYMRVVAHRAQGGDVVLHDGPFDFDNQLSHKLDPLDLKKGDSVSIECTYANTTGRTLHFGESSNDEMCIAGLARYPAGGKQACPY